MKGIKTMKKRKTMKKIIALLLTVIIVICSLPMTAFANTLESTFLESENEAVNEGNENWHLIDEQEIVTDEIIGSVSEVESLREENVKHFRLPDGTYEAVVYSQPVHRKDKEGVWQDIDNTIELTSNAKVSKYATADLRVSFADRFAPDTDLFTLSENGYSISMKLLSDEKELDDKIGTTDFDSFSTPIVNNISEKRSSNVFNSLEEAKSIDNCSSIVYNNTRKNTNIEYVLNGNDVKENIIVNAPCESYEYIFQITLDGLFAELSANGEISVKDSQTNETKYVIPAPYMYDADGNYSYNVSYILEQVKDEIYLLVVTADSEWINAEDRAFPVVIDPTFEHYTVYYDSYIDANNPTDTFGYDPIMWVSNDCAAFIQMDLPQLPDGATVNSAYLHIPYYYHITTGALSAALYDVTEQWYESSICFDNYPNVGNIVSTGMLVASTNITENNPGMARFTITSLVNQWYGGTPNYGVMLMRRNSSVATNQSVILKSYEAYDEPTYISIDYTYYLPDGVYALQNDLYYNQWMSIENDDCWSGNNLQQEYSDISPFETNELDRSRLFKITRIPGTPRYTIRSMLNNTLSFNIVGNEIITKEISAFDDSVLNSDTFSIEWQGDRFLISPYGSSYVIGATSESTANLAPVLKSGASSSSRWCLEKYTGTDDFGYELFPSSDLFIVGETITMNVAAWSTKIGYNYPNLSINSEDASKIDFEWNTSNRTAYLEFLSHGEISINCKIYDQNMEYYDGDSAYYDILSIREGTYFIRNYVTESYMQIEKNAESYYSSGNTVEVWELDSGEYQKWRIVYNGSGYYKIISNISNMALTVPNSSVNATSPLVLESYNGNDRQLWKITKASSGAYIFRPKSGEEYDEDWCMSSDHRIGKDKKNGVVVEQYMYTNDGIRRDEWILARIENDLAVELEAQHHENWCWLAVSRMFAKHYYSNVTLTQEDAIATIKGGIGTDGNYSNDKGSLEQAQQAINYYISNIAGASIDTLIKRRVIYSEENLIRFLNDGHVVYVGRGLYDNMNDGSTQNGGHLILIYGYVIIDTEVYFLIKNSFPENIGKTETISYDKLCYGTNIKMYEDEDNGIWYSTIVINTSYANDTIPYYFDQ